MLKSGLIESSAKGRPPLCVRYASVHLDQIDGLASGPATCDTHSVLWALGVTFDGEHEILGVWDCLSTVVKTCQAIASDLAARGLERVEVLVSRAGTPCEAASTISNSLSLETESGAAVGTETGTAPLIAPHHQTASSRQQALCILPQRVRLASLRADAIVDRLHVDASKALRRHGRFESADAATAFAENWLRAVERRLALDAVSVQRQRRAVAADVLGAAA